MSKKCRAENNGAQKQRSGVIFMEYTHEKYIEMIDEALKVYLGSVSDGQDVVFLTVNIYSLTR
mgnify:CR=1 FL=1